MVMLGDCGVVIEMRAGGNDHYSEMAKLWGLRYLGIDGPAWGQTTWDVDVDSLEAAIASAVISIRRCKNEHLT